MYVYEPSFLDLTGRADAGMEIILHAFSKWFDIILLCIR